MYTYYIILLYIYIILHIIYYYYYPININNKIILHMGDLNFWWRNVVHYLLSMACFSLSFSSSSSDEEKLFSIKSLLGLWNKLNLEGRNVLFFSFWQLSSFPETNLFLSEKAVDLTDVSLTFWLHLVEFSSFLGLKISLWGLLGALWHWKASNQDTSFLVAEIL